MIGNKKKYSSKYVIINYKKMHKFKIKNYFHVFNEGCIHLTKNKFYLIYYYKISLLLS